MSEQALFKLQNTPSKDFTQRDIYTVSRLNAEVRAVLEGSFPLLWVEGEISNLARPSSGHIYFSLKDKQAQVRCAMFRMKRQLLRFQPENGLSVMIRAKVGLYEGRGEFQLIVEHMEPAGEGALRQAFEALKQKLHLEGLFDSERKKPIPALPKQIGLITSPSGAAVRDVLTVIARRFPSIPALIYPVSVQGERAPEEIINALQLANQRSDCDLLIVTRGGGSLEDLMAFNDEGVARAVSSSRIPVISAIGHEIDFTITDFVADQRAPTPSAAAELATPDRSEIIQKLSQLHHRQSRQLSQKLTLSSTQLNALKQRLLRVHPELKLNQQQQRLDDLERSLNQALKLVLNNAERRVQLVSSHLHAATPHHHLKTQAEKFQHLLLRLSNRANNILNTKRMTLSRYAGQLHALSPLATLERGFSITRKADDGSIIDHAQAVSEGESIETLLHRGRIVSRVERVE